MQVNVVPLDVTRLIHTNTLPPRKPKRTPPPEGLIQGITEVEEMFAHNIVQGKLNDQGNYGTILLAIVGSWWCASSRARFLSPFESPPSLYNMLTHSPDPAFQSMWSPQR